MLRHDLRELQECAVRVIDRRRRQIAPPQRLDHLIAAALQLQEKAMRTQSVGTAVQTRDKRGDHLFGLAREMPIAEMQRVREFGHLPKKIGAVAEAFEDVGHAVAVRMRRTILAVRIGQGAGGFVFVEPRNIGNRHLRPRSGLPTPGKCRLFDMDV